MSEKLSSGRTFEKRSLSLRKNALQKNALHFALKSTQKTPDKPPHPTPAQKFVTENPSHRKPKKSRTVKNAKTIRGISRNTMPLKNAQHFPLSLNKKSQEGGGYVCNRDFSEISGVFSGQRSELAFQKPTLPGALRPADVPCYNISASSKPADKRRPRRPKNKKTKKTWGAGKRTQVRVKKGVRGQRKRPLPREKGPRGPCDPLPNTSKRKMYPERPCPNGRARWRSPGPHSGAGRVR